MPASIKPGSSDAGTVIQTLKLAVAPTAPYTLTAIVPIPPESFSQWIAVRETEDGGGNPLTWYYTETELCARINGVDYYEIKARIPSGTATSYKLDRLDQPNHAAIPLQKIDSYGYAKTAIATFVNAHALHILGTRNLLRVHIEAIGPNGEAIDRTVSLTGEFGSLMYNDNDPVPVEEPPPADRIFSRLDARNGWYRRGRLLRTLFKQIALEPGGRLGYMQVFATVGPDTPEIQFDINWHNGGVEGRVGPPGTPSGYLPPEGEYQPPNSDVTSDHAGFGAARCQDILFSSITIEGFDSLPPAPGFAGAWTWSGKLQETGEADTVMRPAQNELVKPVSDSDPNRLHVLPITFERHFRFAVHPSSVTPYQKWIGNGTIAVADWGKDYGGWQFSPLGVPDLTALGATIAATMDLTDQGTNARTSLKGLTPYRGDEQPSNATGMLPVSPLWPGMWDSYAGSASGTGIYPHLGQKQAFKAQQGGLDILYIHMLRCRARMHGCLYYNISGAPIVPLRHAPGQSAPWYRFNRTFLRGSTGPRDEPFRATRARRRVHEADYNPGPSLGRTPTDAQGEPVGNRPDWYAPGVGQPGIPCNTLAVNGLIPLANFDQTLGYTPPPTDLVNLAGADSPDLAAPVIFQIQHSATPTFDETKSITFRITGTGQLGILVTEDVVFTGATLPNPPPSVQSVQSLGEFKTVSSIEVIAITGVLAATELLTIGRASIGVPDYFGTDGIMPLDDQHSVRYHSATIALFLLTNDPIAWLYIQMDAVDARMTYWELGGQAHRLDTIHNGAPGRGVHWAREWAWAAHRIAAGLAVSYAIAPASVVDFFWDTWRQRFRTAIVNGAMSNGLILCNGSFKEMQAQPFGDSFYEQTNGEKFYYAMNSREAAFLTTTAYMMSVVYGHDDPVLRDLIKASARGVQDIGWATTGSVALSPHRYIPIALRRQGAQSISPRTGQLENRIKYAHEPHQADDLWTIYATQADIPAENPISKCVLRPATYPTADDDRYVTNVAGNAAAFGGGLVGGAMSALTLANTDANAAQQPTPVELVVTSGGTFTSAMRRTFKITGTDPWGVVIDDDAIATERLGDSFQGGAWPFSGNHVFPVGARCSVTLLGGTTFLGASQTADADRVTFRFIGTKATGEAVTEDLICLGNGQATQVWTTQTHFKTVTAIILWSILRGNGSATDMNATEKWRWGTRQPVLVVIGNSGATQKFRQWCNFKTVSEIIMLEQTEATDRGAANLGSIGAVPQFKFGCVDVGFRRDLAQEGALSPDAHPWAPALAVFKALAATEADELIKRHANVDGSQGGADTLLAAKNAIKTWEEYEEDGGVQAAGGAPAHHWMPLLWTLRNVS